LSRIPGQTGKSRLFCREIVNLSRYPTRRLAIIDAAWMRDATDLLSRMMSSQVQRTTM